MSGRRRREVRGRSLFLVSSLADVESAADYSPPSPKVHYSYTPIRPGPTTTAYSASSPNSARPCLEFKYSFLHP